jgi:polyisoprenoid-binding protein YceI
MNRTKILVALGVAVIFGVGAFAALQIAGGNGPEQLTFADASSTTAPKTDSSASAPVTTTDGKWIVGSGSQAGYRVLEDRLGGVQNIEAVGRTTQVTGGFEVSGNKVSDAKFVVDVASITSDSGFRDNRFRDSIMEASKFPTATFVAPEITLDSVPAVGDTVKVPTTGSLTLKGVTKEVSTTLEVKRTAEGIQVLGSLPVVFADFGIETPQPPGLKVRDEGTVEFLIVASPES